MEENKGIDSKNIKMEYASNVATNVNREQSMVNDINDWLGQSADAINGQNGTIVVFFKTNRDQQISFEDIAEDLRAVLDKQLRKFQPLNNL